MKLSILGLCAAGAAAILLQTGATAHLSGAAAAETCIKSNVMKHVKPCPVGKMAHHAKKHAKKHASAAPAAEPTVTPTAAAPEACIKTNVMLHVKRCPAGA
jgi:hypothetical protein